MTDIHLLRPHFLYLLIPLVLLVFLLIRQQRKNSIWQQICSKELLPYILVDKVKRSYFSYLLIFFTLATLIVALSGPAWQMISQPVIKPRSGLVIVLDLSVSMNAEDIKPSRLQRAIYKINDILTTRQEGQTALVVFSNDPFVVTPLTNDTATIKNLLSVLDSTIMPTKGQKPSLAIVKASELLSQAGISNGTILLVTAELSDQDMEKAIEVAMQRGVKVSVLGVGTEEGAPIPKLGGGFVKSSNGSLTMTTLSKKNLNQLAKATKGVYAPITSDDSDIHAINKEFEIHPLALHEQTELVQFKWHDQGYLLVLLALPFVSLIFRRGVLILLFIVPHTVQGSYFSDIWKTDDQKAEELFHEEKYADAKELFQNEEWRAAANYKCGDFETAARLFQNNHSANGFYNLGNAKAKLGDFKGALEAYDKALEIQPDHEDAQYNKKTIEELLKQKEQNSNDKKNQKNESEKDQDPNQDKGQQENQNESSKDNSDKPNDSKQENDSKQKDQNQNESKQQNEKQSEELKDQLREKIEKELQESKDNPKEMQAQAAKESDSKEDSQRQIDDLWLQRIEDDPSGLLRRKFLQQYRQNYKAP